MGTDNFNSLFMAEDFYNQPTKNPAAYSVFATEHSTTTANAEGSMKKEIVFIERMIMENPDAPILSFVADSYDIYNFTEKVTDKDSWIREKIESRPNQKFVIRPDSGEPLEVIRKMLEIMSKNEVFDIEIPGQDGIMRKASSNYGILWGDGITPDVIEEILVMVTELGYAAENMVFGSGGDLMQNVNRDTQKFAIKCSSITKPNGKEVPVFKDPITDSGKKSKKGKVTTYFNPSTKEYFVDITGKVFNNNSYDILETVYENGFIIKEYTFEEVRENSKGV
jgi:nicotinamide phosphoribosyltransferase